MFVIGKGGVGKTTVTAALALAFAARGKRVLVAMSGAHERLSSFLATAPVGHDVQQVAENVWATKIEPERANLEYGELVLKVKSVARAVFDNKYTSAFFRAVPGLPEWALLGKAWFHTTEKLEDGRPRYDVVLFDAPSTGHGLDLLRVPSVILDIVPPGVLRRDAEKAWELFHDPARSGVVVVSLPEEMPVTESIELITALNDELHLPVLSLIVNGMLAPLFSKQEQEALLSREELVRAGRAAGEREGSVGERALVSAARRAAREKLQRESLELLEKTVDLKATLLPFLLEGSGTIDGVRELARKL